MKHAQQLRAGLLRLECLMHYSNENSHQFPKIETLVTTADTGRFKIAIYPPLPAEAMRNKSGGKVSEQLEAAKLTILDSKYVLLQEFNTARPSRHAAKFYDKEDF